MILRFKTVDAKAGSHRYDCVAFNTETELYCSQDWVKTDPMTKCKIVQSNMDIQDIILECDFNGYGEARSRDEFFGIEKRETEDLPFN